MRKYISNLPNHHIVPLHWSGWVMSSQINALPRWTLEMEYNNFTRFSNTVYATASAIIVQFRMTSFARPNLSPDISESLDSLLSVMEMGKVCCPKDSCYLLTPTFIADRRRQKASSQTYQGGYKSRRYDMYAGFHIG